MALQRLLTRITPQTLTANGGSNGLITVDCTVPFKTGQVVILRANTLEPLGENHRIVDERVVVKDVINFITLFIGPFDNKRHTRVDASAYTTALNATIEAPEQVFTHLNSEQTIELGEHEAGPTRAKRVIEVDELGNLYGVKNPKPVSVAGITIPPLEVMLTHLDDSPNVGDVHDSIRIGDGTDLWEISPNKEGQVSDIVNNGWETKDIIVTAGSPVEVKVGGSARTNRKIISILPKTGKLKYGHSATVLPFQLFKNQGARFAFGPTTPLFIDAINGTVTVAIGEGS